MSAIRKRVKTVPGKTRDREGTKERITKAVGSLLAKKGFAALGINAVADEAGVDKVLIYRYYGGMPELLRAFGESEDFWPSFEEMTGGNATALASLPLSESIPVVLINFARALRRRPLTQEIMAWETVEQNELTEVLKKVREDMAVRLFQELGGKLDTTDGDVSAITTLLAASVSYLILRSRDTPVFNTVDIRSDKGWKRLESAVIDICRHSFPKKRTR